MISKLIKNEFYLERKSSFNLLYISFFAISCLMFLLFSFPLQFVYKYKYQFCTDLGCIEGKTSAFYSKTLPNQQKLLVSYTIIYTYYYYRIKIILFIYKLPHAVDDIRALFGVWWSSYLSWIGGRFWSRRVCLWTGFLHL